MKRSFLSAVLTSAIVVVSTAAFAVFEEGRNEDTYMTPVRIRAIKVNPNQPFEVDNRKFQVTGDFSASENIIDMLGNSAATGHWNGKSWHFIYQIAPTMVPDANGNMIPQGGMAGVINFHVQEIKPSSGAASASASASASAAAGSGAAAAGASASAKK